MVQSVSRAGFLILFEVNRKTHCRTEAMEGVAEALLQFHRSESPMPTPH